MIDIDRTIRALESDSIGINEKHIENAVKMLKMWRHLKRQASQWEMGLATHLRVYTVMEKAEKEFFPTKAVIVRVLIEKGTKVESHCVVGKIARMSGVVDIKELNERGEEF